MEKDIIYFIILIVSIALITFFLSSYLVKPIRFEQNYATMALEYFFLNKTNTPILVPKNLLKVAEFIAINNDTPFYNQTIYNQLLTSSNTSYSGYVLLYPNFNYSGIIKYSKEVAVNQTTISVLFPYLTNCIGLTNKSSMLLICDYTILNKTLGLQSLLLENNSFNAIKLVKYTENYNDFQNEIQIWNFTVGNTNIYNGAALLYNGSAYLIPENLLNTEFFKLLLSNNYLVNYYLYKIVKV